MTSLWVWSINNNSKLYIVLQLIIIGKFRVSLRTNQYYWLKNCWALLALQARALAKFAEVDRVDTVPVSENFVLSCSSVSNFCGAIFSSTIFNYCKYRKRMCNL